MRMKTGVGETFALVFTKESTITQHDVVDLVTGTLAIQPMPFLRRLLTFSVYTHTHTEYRHNQFSQNTHFSYEQNSSSLRPPSRSFCIILTALVMCEGST